MADTSNEDAGEPAPAAADPLAQAIAAERWDEVARLADAALADPATEHDAGDRAVYATLKALSLGRQGQVEEAMALLPTLAPLDDAPQGVLMFIVPHWLAWTRQLREGGRVAAADAVLAVAAKWPLPPSWRAEWLMQHALAMFAQGRMGELLEPARELGALEAGDGARIYAAFFAAFGHEAQGHGDEALAAARQALADMPAGSDRELLQLLCARVLQALGRHAEAETTLDEMLAAPDAGTHGSAHLMRARLRLQRQDAAGARQDFDAAEAALPALADDLDVIAQRWQAQLALGEAATGLAALRAALGRPALADHPLLLCMVAEGARRTSDGELARSSLRQAAEVPARLDHDAKAWFGAMLANFGGARFDRTQAARRRLLELEPAAAGLPMVELMDVMSRLRADDNPQAEADLATLRRLAQQPGGSAATLALAQGMALLQLQRWAEADAMLASAVALMPSSPDADPSLPVQVPMLRFRAQLAQGRRDEAKATLQQACDADTGPALTARAMRAMALAITAEIHAVDGEHAQALARCGESEKLLVELPPEVLAAAPFWADLRQQLRLQRGQALIALRRYEEALAPLRQVAGEAGAFQALAWHLVGRCRIALEDWHAALATQSLLRAALPGVADAAQRERLAFRSHLDEAAVRVRLREHDAAVQTLQQAIEGQPEAALASPHLWLLLGVAYHQLQRGEPARAALERARAAAQLDDGDERMELRRRIAIALSAVLVKLGQPEAAITTIDDVGLAGEHAAALGYNRGVAALERFRQNRDLAWLDRAREAFKAAAAQGSEAARSAQQRIAAKAGAAAGWFEHWFGRDAGGARRFFGGALLTLAALLLFVAPAWSWWTSGTLDWKLLPAPAITVLLLLLLPGMRNLALSWGEIKFSAEPVAEAASGSALVVPELSPELDVSRMTTQAMSNLAGANGLWAMSGQGDRAMQAFGATFAFGVPPPGAAPA